MKECGLPIDQMIEQSSQATRFLKCVSNESRLMILCYLLDEELSVTSINNKLPLSQSALSQHLAVLRKYNLVNTRRDSQTIYYRISNVRVEALIRTLQRLFSAPCPA